VLKIDPLVPKSILKKPTAKFDKVYAKRDTLSFSEDSVSDNESISGKGGDTPPRKKVSIRKNQQAKPDH
jgi:hypothetical protein